MPRFPFLTALAGFLLLAACDNVGRAFDPVVTPPNQGGTTVTSTIEVPPAGGDIRDGRPIVRATYPSGGGWPSTVPIVVEFSESMNQASILPTTSNGTDAKIVLRPANTTTLVPVVYSFLAGGRVLVLRPLANLDAPQQASYDIVMLPGVRDSDGVRFSATTETKLATFTIDPNATADATVLAVYPRDNQRDLSLDTEFLCFFTRAVDPTSLPNNFVLRPQGGAPLAGLPSLPLSVANVPEARVVGFTQTGGARFAASTTFEFVVNASIRFANNGVLQFSGRTPYSRFTTGGVPNPIGVEVGNPVSGFPNKVNLTNLGNLTLAVEVPQSAAVGDQVVARVYGGDKNTSGVGDLAYIERTVTIASTTPNPTQTVLLSFSGLLGSASRPKFDEGALSFTAQIFRAAAHSGVVRGSSAAAQDTVRPTVVSLGPPAGANGTDLFTELETFTLFGTASEPIGEAAFTVALGAPVTSGLFASRTGGTFLMAPVVIGRRSTAAGYTLTVKDLAGNGALNASNGSLIQRGWITGSVLSGTLDVEAYDAVTLRPVAAAEVLVDVGAPTVPASSRTTGTTDAAGRATFSGLVAASHTITINHPDYDLVTLYNSPVGFASLPLRPKATAAAQSTLNVTPTLPGGAAGTTVVAGSNLFDDAATLVIQSNTNAPTVLAPTAIRPNRPMVLTGFGGVFPATVNPSFTSVYCNLLGTNLLSPAPPAAPVAPGATQTVAMGLRDVGSGFGVLVPYGGIDFSASAGLDLATGSPQPSIRFAATLDGFVGQATVGVGFPSGTTLSAVTANGSFSTPMLTGLAVYSPVSYVVSELRDNAGSIARTRSLLNPVTNVATTQVLPQDVPLRGPNPPSTYTLPPSLDFYDAIDTALVETTVPGSFALGLAGLYDIQIVRENAGARDRGWRVLVEDVDGGVSPTRLVRSYQLPPQGTGATLAAGTWKVTTNARIFLPRTGAARNVLLGEVAHGEVTFSRTPVYTITVQ